MTTTYRRLIAPLAVLAVSLAACSGSDTEVTAEAETTTAVESPTTTVAIETTTTAAPTTTTTEPSVDTDALLADIDAAIAEFIASNGVPGVTLAVIMPNTNGELIELATAGGLSDMLAEREATTADYFRWGSITKTMTSVVVLQLVSEGLIDLDAPVSDYLGSGWAEGYIWEGVDYGDLVTIAQILNHTDGFPEYAFDPGFYIQSSMRIETPYEPEEIIDWAVSVGPQYEPGTDYMYNTVGHVAAGLVIEAVTGKAADEVLRERLFDPASADDAYLTPAEFPPNDDVAGYVQGELKLAIDVLPGYAPYKEASVAGDFYDITIAPEAVVRSAGWTGGGLEAQADDVARIFRSEFTGALDADALDAFLTTSEFSNYGLGISVGEHAGYDSYSHGGGVPGFRSDAVYLPELDITVVASSNLVPIDPDIGSLTSAVLDLVIAAAG